MGPWSVIDLIRLGAAQLAAAGLATTGWYLASGEARIAGQILAANLSVIALLILGYANVMWLMRGRRAVGQRVRAVRGRARDVRPVLQVVVEEPDGGDIVAGADLERFHRATCPMAWDRGWAVQDRGDLVEAGREPCGVCQP